MKKILFFFVLCLTFDSALGGVFQPNVMTTNPVPPYYVGTAFTGTTIYVSPAGNNATAARGGSQFANLYAAVRVAQPGDVIKMETAVYNEGLNNRCGQVPKSLTIIGNGSTIVYDIVGTTIQDSGIYLELNDNLTILNLTSSTPTSNQFSAFIGTMTNAPGQSPTATNVWLYNVGSITADSDWFYPGGTNYLVVHHEGGTAHGYWDAFANTPNTDTNDKIYLDNDEFDIDIVNGINPSARRPINLSGGGGNYYLNNTRISTALPLPGSNIGIHIGGLNCYVFMSNVGFLDGGSGYMDVRYDAALAGRGSFSGYSMTNYPLSISNNLGILPPLPGPPVDIQVNQSYGPWTLPLNVSADPLDGGGVGTFGKWHSYDLGTNGTRIDTNEQNQTAANGGTAIELQPDDGSASAPVAGMLELIDAGLSMSSNYVGLAFTPVPGAISIVASNNQLYAVSKAGTNALAYGSASASANGYYTNGGNASALPNIAPTNSTAQWNTVSAATIVLTNGSSIGTEGPSNVNIIVSGIPVLQFSGSAASSGHFVFGSTNNTLIQDVAASDGGEGVFAGQFNTFSDNSGNHMDEWYIYGGYSNGVSIAGSGGGNNSFTNNTVDASANCYVNLTIQTGTPDNGNHIYGSWNCWITNTSQFFLQGYNEIIDGSNSLIIASSVPVYSSLAIGPNIAITNSDVKAISAGENTLTSTTNNQIILNAPNGIVESYVLPLSSTGLGTVVNTNWVLGGKYSFPYPVQVNAKACLTASAVAGSCDLDLEISGNTTNTSALQTTALSIAASYTNVISGLIPANTTFDFTNRSAGAGDSATVSGGQYIIQ